MRIDSSDCPGRSETSQARARRSGFYRGDIPEPMKDGWLRSPTGRLDATFGMARNNIISLLHIEEGVRPVA